ncbi:hypothetical protein Tco_0532334 [Tanacetum coccineum]
MSSKKPSATKETSKGKSSSKGSKISKSASAKEPVEEPIAEVVMDDTGKDVVVLDQPAQPRFNRMVSALKDPLTFDALMATPIDLSKFVLNGLKIDNLTQDLLLGRAYNLLKGDRYPFDLSKPLPLQEHQDRQTIAADYFFNNDLEYLKSSDPTNTYTTSITKTKAARYAIFGIEDMVPTLWSPYKFRRFSFKEGDFVNLHLNDIKDMLLLAVQHKLFHLNDNDILDFTVALWMFTISLIVKRRIEDLQLGVESYQKKLNITAPQRTFEEIEHQSDTKVFTMTMEILPKPTSSKLCGSLRTSSLMREINTTSLKSCQGDSSLKINLPDHRSILCDEVLKLKNLKKDEFTSFQDEEKG